MNSEPKPLRMTASASSVYKGHLASQDSWEGPSIDVEEDDYRYGRRGSRALPKDVKYRKA